MAMRTASEAPERRLSSRHRVISTADASRPTAHHPLVSPQPSDSANGQYRRSRLTSVSGIPSSTTSTSSTGTRLRTLSISAKNLGRRSEADQAHLASISRSTTGAAHGSAAPSTAAASASSGIGSKRTSWTPQKSAQASVTTLTEPNNANSTLVRPSTSSRIPSISRGATNTTGSSMRLGDALLGQRKVSESASARSGLPSSGSNPSLSLPRRRESLAGSRLANPSSANPPSLKLSASNSSLADSASFASSMGPPSLSQSTSSFAALRLHDPIPTSHSFSSDRTDHSSAESRVQASPSLPQFESGFSAPLFDEATVSGGNASYVTDEGNTPTRQAEHLSKPSGEANGHASIRPSGLTGRIKPNFRLGLRESPQMSSRFSNFSSAVGTPDASDDVGRMVRKNSEFSVASTGGGLSEAMAKSNSEQSMAKSSSEQSMAGLGIGLPSTMQSTGSRSGDLSSSFSSSDRNISAYNKSDPYTPDRQGEHATPSATPVMYDRAGQIGIGELATPRWNFPTSKLPKWGSTSSSLGRGTSADVEPMPRSVSGALSDDGSIPTRSLVDIAGKPRNPSGNSLVDTHTSTFAAQRKAEATRHSRSISYSSVSSAQRSLLPPPEDLRAGLPTSPSVPEVRGTLVSGVGPLQPLSPGLDASTSEFIAELDAADPGSPSYSIDAMTESDPGLSNADEPQPEAHAVVDRLAPTSTSLSAAAIEGARRSPRIGDLPWALGETGPFGTEAAAQLATQPSSARNMAFDGAGVLNALEGEEQWRGSFDLNAAISDLLSDHDKRQRDWQNVGIDGSSSPVPEEARPTSPSKVDTLPESQPREVPAPLYRQEQGSGGRPQALPQQPPTTLPRSSSTRKSVSGSPILRDGPAAIRRSRLTSASGSITGSGSNPGTLSKIGPRLSSISQTTAGHPRNKRASSASIGQSLLRGSMPFGAAEGFGNILNSREDAAADALRKLDGLGGTPRSSRDGRSDASKSPRASRQLSRPGSAGRRTPGSNSRPASPSGRIRRSTNYESPASRSIEKLRGDEAGHRASIRSSRILTGKAKVADEHASIPNTGYPAEASKTPPYASPRLRRSQLPPMPQNEITAGQRHSQAIATSSIREGGSPAITRSGSRSKRTSAASDGSSSQLEAGRHDNSGLLEEPDTHGVPTRGSGIPPVPPLPKLWEASRSNSLNSEAFGSIQASPAISATQSSNSNSIEPVEEKPVLSSRLPVSPRVTKNGSEATSNPSNLRKWSFPNLAGALARSPSTSARSRQASGSNASASIEDLKQRRSTVFGGDAQRKAEAGVASSDQSANVRTSMSSVARVDVLKANKDPSATALGSPQSSRISNDTNMSPRVRRTPSFFQRSSKRSNGSVDTMHTSSQAGESSLDDAKLQDTTPPSSGRLSRKSIMGLAGGLLSRSTSKRNAEAPGEAKAPSASSRIARSAAAPSETQQDALVAAPASRRIKAPSASSRIARSAAAPSETQQDALVAAPASRRISLVARKRGKTLPSSAEPPAVPALIGQKEAVVEVEETADDSTAGRGPTLRVLEPSTSSPSLSGSLIADMDRAAQLVGSSDSRMTFSEVEEMADTTSASAMSHSSSPTKLTSLPASTGSRIPRSATMRTTGKPFSGTSSTSSSNGSASTYASAMQSSIRAVGSSTGSAGPAKAVSSSLAASLGINASSDDDSRSAISSEATNGTVRPALASTALSASSTGSPMQKTGPNSSTTAPTTTSSTLVPILNAYAAAKTPAEVEGVLRRARIAAYSSNLSASEREVLNSLATRNEHRKVEDTPNGTLASKPRAAEGGTPRTAKVLPSSSTSATNTPAKPDTSISVPVRKIRASLSATSSSAKALREAATSTAGRSFRQTAGALGSRKSPVLSDGESIASSPAASIQDEEERLGDLEMEAYIKRLQARNLASGAKQADLDKALEFPDPVAPSRTLSPRQAEVMYGNKMSPYELREIFHYAELFYCGQNATSKHRATLDRPKHNYGFDDERGDYIVTNRDHLAFRYEVVGLLGRGSFGQVLQCRDHKTGKTVAIKLIRNKRRFHHQALVEVKILECLIEWDPDDQFNVLKMTESFLFRNHLCIATELYSMNLYELIKANMFVGFSTKLIRRFTTQMLASLSMMRQHRIVHCDLKPENILLKHPRRSGIKVIDFGSSCFENEKVYTYIQSRFYRSPEVILGMDYHTAIDMWSLGCILAELYTGYPIFPGENEQEQLACIMEVLGPPHRYLIERSTRRKLFFDSRGTPRPVVNSKGVRRRPSSKTLAQALECNDNLFVDFVARCLVWDPERRMKPDAATRHPWILQGRRLASAATVSARAGSLSSSTTGLGLLPRKTTTHLPAVSTIPAASSAVTLTTTSSTTVTTPRSKIASAAPTSSGSGSTPSTTRTAMPSSSSSLQYATSPRRTSAVGLGSVHHTPLRAPRA